MVEEGVEADAELGGTPTEEEEDEALVLIRLITPLRAFTSPPLLLLLLLLLVFDALVGRDQLLAWTLPAAAAATGCISGISLDGTVDVVM